MYKKIVGILIVSLFVGTSIIPGFGKGSMAGKPDPFWVIPSDGDILSGEVRLWAGESSGIEIEVTRFYYSTDQQNWILIGEDWNGTEEAEAGVYLSSGDLADGWSYYWNVSGIKEDWYYLKVKMWTPSEEFWCTDIYVYIDHTPPEVRFLTPGYGDIVQGTIVLSVDVCDEDTEYVLYEYKKTEEYYEKGVEKIKQRDQLKGFGPHGEDWGDVACSPTAAASCLIWWSKQKYDCIMKDPVTKQPITTEQLVKKLAEFMKIDDKGTRRSDRIKGLKDYLNYIKCTLLEVSVEWNGYNDGIKGNECTFERFKNELEAKNEDVLWSIKRWNAAEKKYDGFHALVGNSVNNTVVKEKGGDTDGDGLKEHWVDFMDPWTGKIIKVKMNTDGTFIDSYGWAYPDIFITVSDWKSEYDGEIELAYSPEGGYACMWDTSLISDGYYFIRATSMDDDGNKAEDFVSINVRNINQPPEEPTCLYEKSCDELMVLSTDADGDYIKYGFSWENNQDVDVWSDFIPSGKEINISCNGRTGTIGVIAEDEVGAQSSWVSVKSKDKLIKYPIYTWVIDKLIVNFPFLNKILNQIIL